ncbi:MAG TPA: hypothetical protein VM581_02240 [Magnetospirillaceae bacterium]|nr:hypothetical protein [Magnetospirillaceae bacterium]
MKRLVLIKRSSEPDLAHLYEHIFCDALVKQLRDAGLFSYIDYDLQAKNYRSGFIWLELVLFTTEAKAAEPSVAQLPVHFDSDQVAIGLKQLCAEVRRTSRFKARETVAALEVLQAQPWQPLDQLMHLDALANPNPQDMLRFSERKSHTNTIRCELASAKAFATRHPRLIPLFHVVASAIQSNLCEELPVRHGFFCSTGERNEPLISGSETSWFRHHPSGKKILLDACETSLALFGRMASGGFIERMAVLLQTGSYNSRFSFPSELRIFEATGTLVGGEGWRTLGTQKNIKKLLANTTLFLESRQNRQQLLLREVFGS